MAVGVSWQVQVGCGDVGGGGGGVVYVEVVLVGVGDVDASAECEANITVKLVAASAMLARPAIFPRFVSFNAVTRFLLAAENRVRGQWGSGRLLRLSSRCNALVSRFVGHQGAMLSKDRHVTG
ncbi:MAG TPA: hypothetical protein VH136_04480 [Trebonia sp.]|nr:hypothetical protein [Trebonia sp.]